MGRRDGVCVCVPSLADPSCMGRRMGVCVCVCVPSSADPSWDVGRLCVCVPSPADPLCDIGRVCVHVFPHRLTPRGT